MERYREVKRQRQIAGAGKRKREDDEAIAMEKVSEKDMGTGAGIEGATDKRAKVEMAPAPVIDLEGSDELEREEETSRRGTIPPAPPPDDGTIAAGTGVAGPSQAQVPPKLNCSKVSPDVRGHTSYLTFARLVPIQ